MAESQPIKFTLYTTKNATAPDSWRIRPGLAGGLKLTFSVATTRDAPETKLSFDGTWGKKEGVEIQITRWTEDTKNHLLYVTDGSKVYRLRFVSGHSTETGTYESTRQKLQKCVKISYEPITK
jgi:hypothetical protein